MEEVLDPGGIWFIHYVLWRQCNGPTLGPSWLYPEEWCPFPKASPPIIVETIVNLNSSSYPWGSINLPAKGNPGESNSQVTSPLKRVGHYSLWPRAPSTSQGSFQSRGFGFDDPKEPGGEKDGRKSAFKHAQGKALWEVNQGIQSLPRGVLRETTPKKVSSWNYYLLRCEDWGVELNSRPLKGWLYLISLMYYFFKKQCLSGTRLYRFLNKCLLIGIVSPSMQMASRGDLWQVGAPLSL